jgi:hypothetical protein
VTGTKHSRSIERAVTAICLRKEKPPEGGFSIHGLQVPRMTVKRLRR